MLKYVDFNNHVENIENIEETKQLFFNEFNYEEQCNNFSSDFFSEFIERCDKLKTEFTIKSHKVLMDC